MTTNTSKGMIEVDWGVSIEINSLTVQQPSGLQGGIFVEALYCHNGQKKWRIKSEAYFYGKDKTWIDFYDKEQFTDTYCWDDMVEAFLFAQKHLIEN